MAHGRTVLKLNKTLYNNELSTDSKLTLCLLACQIAYLHTVTFFHQKDEMPCKSSMRHIKATLVSL